MEERLDEALGAGKEIKINTRNNDQILPIIYGTVRIGGNDVFIEPKGNENKYLWVVQNLAEGECNKIHLNDAGVPELYLDNNIYTKYGSKASHWFYRGTSEQVYNGQMHVQFSDWTENKRNTCYIVWRFTHDVNLFQGLPQRNVVLEGLKIYDLRTEDVTYNNNPAICLYDYLTNTRYGLGIDSSKLDRISWINAANYCDTKSWSLNTVINGETSAFNAIEMILLHFRGQLIWWDDKFYLYYADLNYESSVMSITDDHIVQSEDGIAQVQIGEPSRINKPEGLRVTWVNPDKSYETDSLLLGEDNGTIQDLPLHGCTNKEQASHMGVYELERRQLDKMIRGVFRDDCLKLEPHDIITLTSTALSISGQLMRVVSSNILSNGTIELTLVYESNTLYDDSYNLDEDHIYTCTLADPSNAPLKVSNVRVTEINYKERLRRRTRLLIEFDNPINYPYFNYVEVWINREDLWTASTAYIIDNYVRYGSKRYRCILAHTSAAADTPGTGVNWATYWVEISYEMLFISREDFEIDPVEELKTYYIRLKTVTIWNSKTSDTNDYNIVHTVGGYTSLPGDLGILYAIINQNAVLVYADKVTDSDIELYEFRLGTSWSAGLFLAALRSPNLSLVGCKPGTHSFLANTLSNNGLYGENAVTAAITLPDPPKDWGLSETGTISNLVTNGDTEDDANWADVAAGIGSRSAVQAHQGTFSRKFVSIGAGDGQQSDAFTTVNGATYGVNLWVYPDDTGRVQVKVRSGDNSTDQFDAEFGGLTQDAWNEINFYYTEGGGTGGAGAFITIYDKAGDTGDWYFDDVCIIRGTFSNTQCYLYNGDPFIRCISGVLTGTYTTHIFDWGASSSYMVYEIGDLVVVGGGTDWGSIIPSPTTWANIGLDTRTWVQVFSLTTAPSVSMVLKYGIATPPANEVAKMEILSTIVTGRYYQLEITITDPSININALVEAPVIKFCLST